MLVLSADIWQDVGGAGTITSTSYNGTALTKVTNTRSGGMASEIWYLVNPPSGTNTMSVTVTGATDAIKLAVSTFTNVTQSSPVDVSNTATGSTGNPSVSATTTTANDLVVATLSRFSTTAASTNRTSLYNNTTGSILGASSYQIQASAGSSSDTYTGSTNNDWSMVMAAFKPYTTSPTTTVKYIHTDHLTGSSVVSDSSGAQIELLDYFPYGNTRIDSGSYNEQRKYTGLEYDVDTGLNYAINRYYNSAIGRFISQDPVFLELGSKPITTWEEEALFQELLSDPQKLNSYSYARNNPLIYTDRDGRLPQLVVVILVGLFAPKVAQAPDLDPNTNELANAQLPAELDALTMFVGGTKGTSGKMGSAKPGIRTPKVGGSVEVKGVKVPNSGGKTIYRGNVNVGPTVEGINKGTLRPRTDARGNPKFYQNREGHSQLDYSNGNQYLEYNVTNSGAPKINAERMLVGTKNGDMYYSPDHYKTIHKVSP